MKFLLTADLHLAAPLNTHLSPEKSAMRDRELTEAFRRLCEDGIRRGARAVLIAGDLFDGENVPARTREAVFAVLRDKGEIPFFYIPGNHDRHWLIGENMPRNLYIFGDGWSSYTLGEVTIFGRADIENLTFSDLYPVPSRKNIVLLHGAWNKEIPLTEAAGRSIDLLALGHYHTYATQVIDGRGVAVYPGTPEGRGFDETGEKGYALYDTESSDVTFIPCMRRCIHDIPVDITGITTGAQIPALVHAATANIPADDLLRVRLTGRVAPGIERDLRGLEARFSDRFFLFLAEDESELLLRPEDYIYDRTLRGEFIRQVMASDLDEREKHAIMDCGLSALAGGN